MASRDGSVEGEVGKKRARHGGVVVDESALRAVFHMPITEAAARVRKTTRARADATRGADNAPGGKTVRCRELGIARWPFRKMRKLDNMISFLEKKEAVMRRGEREGSSKLETIKKTRELVLAQPNSNAHTRVGKINSQLRRQVLESSSTSSISEDEGSGKSGLRSLDASGSGSNEQSQRSARTNDATFAKKKRYRSDWEQTSASTEATAHGGLDSLIDAATAMVSKDAYDKSSDEHASDDGSSLSTMDASLHRMFAPFCGVSPFEMLQLHMSGAFAARDVARGAMSHLSNTSAARECPPGIYRPVAKRFDPSTACGSIAALASTEDASASRRALVAEAAR